MLKTVRKAFQIEDIRKRLFYTFVMLVIVRLGSQLPTPGVDPALYQGIFCTVRRVTRSTFLTRSPEARLHRLFRFCIEHYTVHHFIHYYAASHNCNSEIRGDAERRRRWKKEDCGDYPLCDSMRLRLIESTAMAVGFGRQGLLEEYNFVNCCSCRTVH